jgi:hypothetical protein
MPVVMVTMALVMMLTRTMVVDDSRSRRRVPELE